MSLAGLAAAGVECERGQRHPRNGRPCLIKRAEKTGFKAAFLQG